MAVMLIAVPSFAATVNVNPGMSTAQIQTAINGAPSGSTISFAAGSYTLTAPLAFPCSNLQLTGPVAATATAILSAFNLDYPGGCMAMGSVKYLGFANSGVYVAIGNNGNFTFENNQVTKLNSAALMFDGNLGTTLTNVLIDHDTLGDPSSCAWAFTQTGPLDPGGYCAGVTVSQGVTNGFTFSNNIVEHMEEGIHFNQLQQWSPGATASVCISCVISGNYIHNFHRIGIEIQTGTPTNPVMVTHNAVIDPLNSFFGTFSVSLACCQWSATMGTNGFSPGVVFDDNVVIASQPCGPECPPYGVEFWGNGSQGTNSLVEGSHANGYTWGWGNGSWAINNNYICGPMTNGGYITNQQNQSPANAPAQAGNTTGSTCKATSSVSPSIAPPSGSFTSSLSVVLADAQANTSVWYTTDGTQPVPGIAKLYTGPFTITSTTTVKAVGMWGNANQPTSYPAGFGYVPSAMVSATYTSGAPTQPCIQQILNPQKGTYTSTTVVCP